MGVNIFLVIATSPSDEHPLFPSSFMNSTISVTKKNPWQSCSSTCTVAGCPNSNAEVLSKLVPGAVHRATVQYFFDPQNLQLTLSVVSNFFFFLIFVSFL